MTIGNVIVELRKERNLSQKKLADSIGVSQSAIAQIEVNRNEATAATIRKLAEFFEVTTDYLLGMEDDFGNKKVATYPLPIAEQQYTVEEKLIIEEYRKLPKTSKELVRRMVGITEKKNV